MDSGGREISIDLPDGQVHILLPEDVELPEWTFRTIRIEEQLELIPETDGCNHDPIMHKLSGGCMAPGCECNLTRFDRHEGNSDTSS